MLESVLNAVVGCLEEGGLSAFAAYPRAAIDRSGSFVCVGLRAASQGDGAFAGYLGTRADESGNLREVYGLRCSVTLALDVYAGMDSENAAGDCIRLMDEAAGALRSLQPGLKLQELRWGESGPDKQSGMFRCRGEAKCLAYLTAESGEGETAEFSDFILRGELKQ